MTTTKPTALQQVIRLTHSVVIQCICLSLNILLVWTVTQVIYEVGRDNPKNAGDHPMITLVMASIVSFVLHMIPAGLAFVMFVLMGTIQHDITPSQQPSNYNTSFALVNLLLHAVLFISTKDWSGDVVKGILYFATAAPLLYAVGYVTVKTMPKEQ